MVKKISPLSLCYFLAGIVLGFSLVRTLGGGLISLSCFRSKSVPLNLSETEGRKRVFVGVMTANKFLNTRARAAYETWGKDFGSDIAFFSSENSSTAAKIPLVRLKDIDDSYPPQRKSIAMLKYMYERHPDFDFYFRADDDLYIRHDKLQGFLSSLDGSKPLMIGQGGLGVKEERRSLRLERNTFFCMGGPGIIISHRALQLLSANIDKCSSVVVSSHEDVELWRCIRHYVGISCTSAINLSNVFYHNYGGKKAFTGDIQYKDVINTMTLHPLKNPLLQYKLDLLLQRLKIQEKEHDIHVVMKEIQEFNNLILNNTRNAIQLDNAKEGIFFQHLGSLIPCDAYIGTEWDLVLGNSMYTTNGILSLSPSWKSTTKIAVENIEAHIIKSIFRNAKVQSNVYTRNLRGISVEYFIEMNFLKKTLRKRKFTKKALILQKPKKQLVKIPYGPLLSVRESRHNFSAIVIQV